MLLVEESAGGQVRLSEDDYVEGAPELVVEIAASSVAVDLNDKKRAYSRNGVEEYIIWQVFDRKLDWFRLQDGDYVSLSLSEQGIIHSQVFPRLWLAVPELLAGNMQTVLAVLREGLQSPEHQVFVQQLARSPQEE